MDEEVYSDLSLLAAHGRSMIAFVHQHSMHRGNAEAHNNDDCGGQSRAFVEPSFACAHGMLNRPLLAAREGGCETSDFTFVANARFRLISR